MLEAILVHDYSLFFSFSFSFSFFVFFFWLLGSKGLLMTAYLCFHWWPFESAQVALLFWTRLIELKTATGRLINDKVGFNRAKRRGTIAPLTFFPSRILINISKILKIMDPRSICLHHSLSNIMYTYIYIYKEIPINLNFSI